MVDVKNALFLLLRHGTTKLNEEEKFRGWSDDDSAALDSKGIKQAKLAAAFLATLPIKFGLLVSSDLDRSIHTAAIVASKLKINDIHYDKRVRPLNVGDYTGENKSEISIDAYLKDKSKRFPGGESINEFDDRQKDFSYDLFAWSKDHPGEKALEIGHLSNVIYWQDLDESYNGYLKHYATDKKDLLRPGGVAAIMPDKKVVPLLGENKKAVLSDKGDE